MQGAAFIRRLARDSRGATMVEYGLLIALIALGFLAFLGRISAWFVTTWTAIANAWTA